MAEAGGNSRNRKSVAAEVFDDEAEFLEEGFFRFKDLNFAKAELKGKW